MAIQGVASGHGYSTMTLPEEAAASVAAVTH